MSSFRSWRGSARPIAAAPDHGDWHIAILDYVPRRLSVPPWSPDAIARTVAFIARFHAEAPARAAQDVRPFTALLEVAA